MRTLTPARAPVAPLIGQFHAELRPFGSQLDAVWRARISITLGKIAEARGRHERARQYGVATIEALRRQIGWPAALPDQATRPPAPHPPPEPPPAHPSHTPRLTPPS